MKTTTRICDDYPIGYEPTAADLEAEARRDERIRSSQGLPPRPAPADDRGPR